MLGRAVNEFQPPTGREKALSGQFSSSPPVKDEAKLQQSIGAFAGVRNTSMTGYNAAARPEPQKPYSRPVPAANYKNSFSRPSGLSTASSTSSSLKRKSSEISTGIAATLSSGSFVDVVDSIDLTQDDQKLPKLPRASTATTLETVQQYGFDPNDFDDDDDLDLDVEYPTGLPPSSTRKPLHPVSQNIQPAYALPDTKLAAPTIIKPPDSSAVTWPSSPIANKRTPMRATIDVAGGADPSSPIVLDAEPSSEDIRPPTKRRLPWSNSAVEKEEAAAEERESQDNVLICGKCGAAGHHTISCRSRYPKCSKCGRLDHHFSACPDGRSVVRDSKTPLQKEKLTDFVFNTTASALKAKEKAFREHQKSYKSEKQAELNQEQMKNIVKSTTANPRIAPIFLSDEQKKVLALVRDQNQSVFFTGSAGTGKSVLMRAIIDDLKKKYHREADRVAVTASTGLAACNINGMTLHSFSGIGLGKEDAVDLVKKIQKNAKAKTRWLRTKVLIIDEISMVDGELFDKLEEIARRIRKNGRPFGGIQLVITGDFFQLPPVPDYGKQATFAFDANTWLTSIHHTIGLTEVFRQKDPEFAQMLNEMRLGTISDQTIKTFRKLDRPLEDGLISATELFPTRNEVDNANATKMRSLQGKSYVFRAVDGGKTDEKQRDKLLSNLMAPSVIELKKGAQVMLIKNMDEGLVNGSLGRVKAFMSEQTFSIYDERGELPSSEELAQLTEEASRKVSGLSKFKNKLNPQLTGSTEQLYPLVSFEMSDGSERQLLCQPEEWKIELPNGEVQAFRRQLPLILAWALSIHKAQGQTLERVKVDLKKVFENGQAYVALSRATTKEGLQVSNFNKKAIMAHPRVAEFYNGLYSVNKALMQPKVAPARPPKPVLPDDFMDSGIMDHTTNWEYEDEEEAMALYE